MELQGVDRRLVAYLARALEAREEVLEACLSGSRVRGQTLSCYFDSLPQLDEMDAVRRHAAAAERGPRP